MVGSRNINVLSVSNGGWTIREGMRTTTSFTVRTFSAAISISEEEVIEMDDSLRWDEVSIVVETIEPSGGMMCQGMRKEIQTKGVIGDSIHFDALGTGRSPFLSAVISELFKRVGSERDILQI
nr:hypothetical protein [Tanacetum cinerariifolium]